MSRRALSDRELDAELNLDISDYEEYDESQSDPDFNPDQIVDVSTEDGLLPQDNSRDSSSSSSSTDRDDPALPIRTFRGTRGRGVRRAGSRRVNRTRGRLVSRNGTGTGMALNNSMPMGDWVSMDFNPQVIPLIEPSYLPIDSSLFSKMDYFNQNVDRDLINLIVVKSNQTYIEETGRSLNLTVQECYIYFGITMAMSCIGYPIIRMYWETKFRVPLVADNMSRARFFLLRNSIKLVYDLDVNTEMRQKDRLWKVRPLLDRVVSTCKKQEKQCALSIDEMIIPFTGSCAIKQFCPGKPNPTGLKAFVLANPNGIICDLHIYQGTSTYPQYEDTPYGLGEKAVLSLTEDLVPGHIIYFDRYFTTLRLCKTLQEKGLMSAGTLMRNRIPGPARNALKSDRQLKASGRGSSHVLVNDQVALTKWFDNKPVLFMSTVHANQTSDVCARWCKRSKTYVNVSRPEVVKAYNSNMGGVDLADRLLAVCPFRYRTKKWTQRFIAHMMDIAVMNSCLQYKADQLLEGIPPKKIMQLRAFKLELAETIINFNTFVPDEPPVSSDENSPPPRKRGRAHVVSLPSIENRQHGALHLPTISDKQNKCRLTGCKKKSTIMCQKCNVYLCLTKGRNCYTSFHS